MTMTRVIVIWNIIESLVLGFLTIYNLVTVRKLRATSLSLTYRCNDEARKSKLWQRVAGGNGGNLLRRKHGHTCYAQGCKEVVLDSTMQPLTLSTLSFQIAGQWYTFCHRHAHEVAQLREEFPSALKEFSAAAKKPDNIHHLDTARERVLNLRRLEFILFGDPETPIC
jgi:hypothetical protein